VNLTERKVLKVVDQGGPIPKDDLTFEPNADKLTPKARLWREAETTSATVDGNSVEWGPWSFSFGMHPREGLVLHLVKLRDKDNRARTVLHRASLSEMAVPYGDPEEGWHGRTVFDAGETGMGKYGRTSLSPGVEAPLNARFFNAVVNDEKGDAVDVPRAIALFERTSGTLWRHRGHGVPAHELVLMSYATIDNYDYGIQWIFREDGVLRVDMELTGIMGVKASEVGNAVLHAGHATGTQVSHHSMAPNHQHFFNFRLDFDVDGPASNSVARVEGGGLPIGPENPHGNLIMTKTTTFETEKDGQDIVSIEGSRKWKILSNSAQPVHGKTPGGLSSLGKTPSPSLPPGPPCAGGRRSLPSTSG
jgi:primary-amine oxidase